MISAKSKHYVICNWNERAFGIILQLHSDLLRLGGEDYEITVINKEEVKTKQIFESYGKYFYNVKFHYGDPSDKTVLSGAGVDSAIRVVVLSENDVAKSSDPKTMLTFLALKKLREELKAKNNNSKKAEEEPTAGMGKSELFGVILEFVDESSLKNHFKNILENEKYWVRYLFSNIVDSMLFGQSARTPGIVKLFFDLLTFSHETNEIYRHTVPEELLDSDTQKISFDEAYNKLLNIKVDNSPVLLMGAFIDDELYINPETGDDLILDQNSELLVLAKAPIDF